MVDLDLDAALDATTEFLDSYRAEAGAEGYVLGVSGGLDSAVAATLAARAVGPDRVAGMVLPGAPSDPGNMADARELCADLGIECLEADIEPVVDAVTAALPGEQATETVGNVRARVRMVLLYGVANERDLLVCGTGNRSEHALGYFTKYGDGATDLEPMGNLYKTEVAALARRLGRDRFAEKTPTAGLWEGQTDEAELGADYGTIDAILRRLLDRDESAARVAEETGHDLDLVRRFAELHRRSAHKRRRPPAPEIER